MWRKEKLVGAKETSRLQVSIPSQAESAWTSNGVSKQGKEFVGPRYIGGTYQFFRTAYILSDSLLVSLPLRTWIYLWLNVNRHHASWHSTASHQWLSPSHETAARQTQESQPQETDKWHDPAQCLQWNLTTCVRPQVMRIGIFTKYVFFRTCFSGRNWKKIYYAQIYWFWVRIRAQRGVSPNIVCILNSAHPNIGQRHEVTKRLLSKYAEVGLPACSARRWTPPLQLDNGRRVCPDSWN